MTRRRSTRRMLVALLATGLAASVAGARDASETVLETQDRRFAATVGVDLEALERMLADDMTYTHSNAKVESKAEFLAALREGQYRYRSIDPEERRVRLYGDAAVVAGVCRVRVEAGAQDIDVRLRFTELYVKQEGAWRLALWHSTRVP